jgi:hypothetical protein
MYILLSAPHIVSQALTFDFRPSGCELEDCHSDGHKRQPELELSGRSVTVCTNSPIMLLLLLSFEVAFIYNNMIIMIVADALDHDKEMALESDKDKA